MNGHHNLPPISAAILAGGQSRRMGTDKALVSLLPGGPPLLEIVIERLRPLTDDLFIVATDRPAYARFGVPVHPDCYGATGVLGGIGSALRYARHEHCLVVGCDMPFLDHDLLQGLIAGISGADAVVPRIAGKSRQGGSTVLQPLHAVYSRRCLLAVERALRQGRLQAIAFLPDVHVRVIGERALRRLDPNLRSLVSVNTPEMLAAARQWATEASVYQE